MPAVAAFLYDTLESSGRYRPALFSVPMDPRDPLHRALRRPSSWLQPPRAEERMWQGHAYTEFGTVGGDLIELARIRPRRALTQRLNAHDLVQVVAGVPAWATLARDVRRPVMLQTATLTRVERQAALSSTGGACGAWLRATTRAMDRADDAALAHVATAFVENRWMLDHLSTRMPRGAVVFAPPGVDTSHFRPAETPVLDGPIVAVGRWADPRKNVGLLFRAYGALRARRPTAPPLVLAGLTGPPPAAWALADALGIRPHVTHLANLSGDALADLYRRAAVVALSSDEEGLGIVLLEAMASGVPVVATACGGPETAVVDGETGYLVPVGDAEAMADRLGRLVGDADQCRRLGAAARARAVAEFSLTAAGRRFLDVYDRTA